MGWPNLPAVLGPTNAEHIVKVSSVGAVEDEWYKFSGKMRRGPPDLDLVGVGDRKKLAVVGELCIAEWLLEVHLGQ